MRDLPNKLTIKEVITMKATITVATENALIKAFEKAARAVAEGDVEYAKTLIEIADRHASRL